MNSPKLLRSVFQYLPAILLCLGSLHFTGCSSSNDISSQPSAPSEPVVQPPVVLAGEDEASHVIVLPESATRLDRYAADELALYLGVTTGAEFAVVEAAELADGQSAIFIGESAAARNRLGVSDMLTGLSPFTSIVRTAGQDVFLYGNEHHSNLNAVMHFLEGQTGWRWFSVFESPRIQEVSELVIEPVNLSYTRSFPYLSVHLHRSMDFPIQHGANMRFDKRVGGIVARDERTPEDFPFFSALREVEQGSGNHTLYSFIPPVPDNERADVFDWLEKKDYFATNPDFFSMNERGERYYVRGQLNFGNPELRAELTRNILRLIEIEGDEFILELGAMDNPGRFCLSPESVALEEKYQTPAGPLVDYLIEIGNVLKEQHPKMRIKTLAYRRNQTQIPPTLPDGEKLPDNIIIEFAPIEDNYFADWTHPDESIQETFLHLQQWGDIVADGNLWAWIYPNPFGTGLTFPVGNIQRLITNMQLMHEVGVRGLFLDHAGLRARSGWSELQAYLIYKLSADINRDPDPIIDEFLADQYGAAAPLLRHTIEELEAARLAMDPLPSGVHYASRFFTPEIFPYLTPEAIHSWQLRFDEMEQLTADAGPRIQDNLQLARREFDAAAVWAWLDLRKEYPEYYTDPEVVVTRIRKASSTRSQPIAEWDTKNRNREWANSRWGTGALDDFMVRIAGGGEEKPLPAQFDNIDPDRIVTLMPNRQRGVPKTVVDPDAAMGFAVVIDSADYPLSFGFHQMADRNRIHSHKLEKADITPGVYQIHEIGEVPMQSDSRIYFGRSWQTHLDLGELLYEPGAENLWRAYITIKLDGARYGGEGEETVALADRIIMVRVSDDQF